MDSSNLSKYKSKNPIKKFLIKRFLNNINIFLSYGSPKNVLDVGCGEGFTISFLRKLHPEVSFTGIDNSFSAVETAKKNNPGNKFITGSIYTLPLPSSSFDLVICSEVLEHLDNPDIALKELNRVSSKYLLLSVPNEPLFRISSFISGQYLSTLGRHPEHIQSWNKKSFIILIKKYFTLIKVKTSFPWIITLLTKNDS